MLEALAQMCSIQSAAHHTSLKLVAPLASRIRTGEILYFYVTP
jgi:hypothetical protein